VKYFSLFCITAAALGLSGKEAADLLREKALKGEPYAMIALGDEFFRGEKRPRNYTLAAYWYRKAAEKNVPLGLYRYGVCLEFGWGTEKNPRLAFEKYCAAGKYAAAQLRVAEMLLQGVPGTKTLPAVDKDPLKGVTIMRALCKAHYYPALMKLAAVLYRDPQWRKVHGKEIYTLVLSASNADPVPADVQVFQARLLQEGVGVERDDVFARALLEIAAKKGSSEAEFLFARCLENGQGCPVNEKKAFEYYSKSAEKLFPAALLRMGDYYLAGNFVPQDPAEGVKLFKKAVSKNHPPALRKLGWCYENGIGMAKDLKQAFNFYEHSAQLQDPEGCYHTGRCLLEGIGVQPDPAGAVYFFRRGALLGNRSAMLALAQSLRTGRGCTPDPAAADLWLKRAAD
jgi:TPR repeat protein